MINSQSKETLLELDQVFFEEACLVHVYRDTLLIAQGQNVGPSYEKEEQSGPPFQHAKATQAKVVVKEPPLFQEQGVEHQRAGSATSSCLELGHAGFVSDFVYFFEVLLVRIWGALVPRGGQGGGSATAAYRYAAA